MKIVHITIYPPKDQSHSYAGGVASYSKNLISKMPTAESDTIHVLCDKINGKCQKYQEDNIEVIRCFDKKPKFVWQILKEVRKIKPDIIHVQQELGLFGNVLTAYLLQWLLFLLHGYKLVVTLHGVVSLKKINKEFVKGYANLPVWLVRLAFFIIYRPLCLWSKKIIVHEEYFKKILVNEYYVPEEKMKVIFHGIEDLRTIGKKGACQKIDLDENKNIVLYMGYLSGYKDLDLLIEGFAQYTKMDPNAYLIIGAGKHPGFLKNTHYLRKYRRLQNKAGKMIHPGQYRWVGFIDEGKITDYFSASDVSVYPYKICLSSSGPMALAIGYEKPFLASEAFKETIHDKSFIFQNEPRALADKINDFFTNRKKFQTKIKKLKQKRLWGKAAQQTYALYQDLYQ